MIKHVKIYLDYFDYKTQEEVVCEACLGQATEIHHIHGRGKGKDNIQNLMALCRRCHERAHASKHYVSKEEFALIHNSFLLGHRKKYLK